MIIKKNLIQFLILLFFVNPVFAEMDDKVGNVNYLRILQEKESAKKQTYGFDLEGAGLYLAPSITTIDVDDEINLEENNRIQDPPLESSTIADLNYHLKSNIGINFNKYFTGFLAYDLGDFGINSAGNEINFNIDSSTIKLNGFGSKINFSHDFYLKMMYLENDLDESDKKNLDSDKERQFQLNGVINF